MELQTLEQTRLAADRDPVPVRALHWGTVVLVIVAAATIVGRELVDDTAPRIALLALHRQLGLLVLVALAARVGWGGVVDRRDHAGASGRMLRAWALPGAVALHVAAALWRHRHRRDGAPRAKLPDRTAIDVGQSAPTGDPLEDTWPSIPVDRDPAAKPLGRSPSRASAAAEHQLEVNQPGLPLH